MIFVLLALGLAFLAFGAEILVKKAHFLSKSFHLNPFFIGVILLGMGTSAPEWAVSAFSAFKNLSNLAISNVFGSNIFNILLVLGLVLLKPLKEKNWPKKDILFLSCFSFLLIGFIWDSYFSLAEAVTLLLLFIFYVIYLFISSKPFPTVNKTPPIQQKLLIVNLSLLIFGFVLLIGGSYLTVTSAEQIALKTGVSERLIGLLVVSVGTGLPELFASITALLRGHKEMALGNIIGSNIFNTFAILGTTGIIRPAELDPQLFWADLPVLLITHSALLLFILNKSFQRITKMYIPYFFIAGYLAYITFLIFLS